MENKKKVVIIFGGQSTEHEVSCVSAITIIKHLNQEKYEPVLLGITKEGLWKKVDSIASIEDGSWRDGKISALLSPDRSRKAILYIHENIVETEDIDVVFPALHGLFGEDGTLQGLLELAGIPYVGCGVLASAISMDKYYTKQIVDRLGIRQARCFLVRRSDLKRWEKKTENIDASKEKKANLLLTNQSFAVCEERSKEWESFQELCSQLEEAFGYPVFVKPSNAGSSCGITKVHNREELLPALRIAQKHDRKIIIEENICGRELECAVLGGASPKASVIGEIIPDAEFYDYDAKYNSENSKTIVSPKLPKGKTEELQSKAVKIFKALDEYGLSRVDFFMEEGTNEIVFNEINTLPGFTSISMYPMLWNAKGVDTATLVNRLLELSLKRELSLAQE